MKKIICIGSVTRDIFMNVEADKKIDDKISFPAGAKIYSHEYKESLGGGVANVGAGLVKAGFRVFAFSRTDKSMVGKWILKQVKKIKLKKNYLQQNRGGVPSATSVVLTDKIEGDRVIIRSGDAVDRFDLEKACRRFRERVDWIYISSQKKNGMKNLETIVNFANQKKAKITLNPSSYQLNNDNDSLLNKLSDITVLFLNLQEARQLLGEEMQESLTEKDIDQQHIVVRNLMEKILTFGVKIVCITDGSRGAWVAGMLSGEMVMYYLHAFNTDSVADTTGAGDAFASGFMALYIYDEDDLEMRFPLRIQRALAGGIANSSGVITEVGATKGLLKESRLKKEAEKLLSEIIEVG